MSNPPAREGDDAVSKAAVDYERLNGAAQVELESAREVCRAAESWWLSKRPAGWCEAAHLVSPTVNTATPREMDLARAVAAIRARAALRVKESEE